MCGSGTDRDEGKEARDGSHDGQSQLPKGDKRAARELCIDMP
jgi:hypothetical protein